MSLGFSKDSSEPVFFTFACINMYDFKSCSLQASFPKVFVIPRFMIKSLYCVDSLLTRESVIGELEEIKGPSDVGMAKRIYICL